MVRFSRAVTSPRGFVPQIGDNDSGRVLPLRDRLSLDHGYLVPLGAALFGEEALKDARDVFPDEAAWLLGEAGLRLFRALGPSPSPEAFSSSRGGFHVLRTGRAVVTLSAGPSGQGGMGGHNHNDALSFELHLDGEPLIVDAGTGSYTRDLKERHGFRSTAAHNTLQLDGRELSLLERDRPFARLDTAHAHILAVHGGHPLARMTAEHFGFSTPSSPLRVRRTLLLDADNDALSIEDELEGQGGRTVTFRLHLCHTDARMRALTEDERRRALRVPRGPMSPGAQVVEIGPAEAPRAVVVFPKGVTPRLVAVPYSPGYGELQEGLAITWEAMRTLPMREGCVILFEKG